MWFLFKEIWFLVLYVVGGEINSIKNKTSTWFWYIYLKWITLKSTFYRTSTVTLATITHFWFIVNRHEPHNSKATNIICSSTLTKLKNLGEIHKWTATSTNILWTARKHSSVFLSRVNLHAGQPSHLIKFVRVTSEVKNIIHTGNVIGILIHSKGLSCPFSFTLSYRNSYCQNKNIEPSRATNSYPCLSPIWTSHKIIHYYEQ